MLSQRGVVRRAERQVADEPDDGLDERPPAGRVEKLDEHRQAVVQPHGILGHLRFGVARRQVTQRADL